MFHGEFAMDEKAHLEVGIWGGKLPLRFDDGLKSYIFLPDLLLPISMDVSQRK